MECLVVFVVLVIVFVMTSGAVTKVQLGAAGRNRMFETLAKRYHGRSRPAGWFGDPSCVFYYGGAHVLVGTVRVPARTGKFLQVELSWPDVQFRCEIFPLVESIGTLNLRQFNGLDQSPPAFGERYVIRGLEPREQQTLLTPGVQWQIEQLRRGPGGNDIYVTIQQGVLIVRKCLQPRHVAELIQFTEQVLTLFDQCSLAHSVGIEFVNDGVAQVITEALCQVCGEDIESEMVFCRRCKTPHHQDCWHYNGACSTYGCQETQYFLPQAAQPTGSTSRRSPKPR